MPLPPARIARSLTLALAFRRPAALPAPDADLASVINLVRKNFAPGAAEVTTAQVAARRAK